MITNKNIWALAGLVLLAVTFARGQSASPSTTAPTTSSQTGTTTLPPVVVKAKAPQAETTASKTSPPNYQTTGATVDYIPSQTIQDRNATTLRTLLQTVSDINVNNQTEVGSVPTFTVRGQNEDVFIDAFGGTPNVAYYVDDIPALSVYSRTLPVYNLESAELLKGPYGTQYGAPGSAGVLRLNSILPDNDYRANVDYIFGSYDRQQVQGGVSGPIIKDTLALGFDGSYQSREGYVTNSVLNDPYGGIDEGSGRMQLVWTPVEQMEVLLTLGIATSYDGGPNFNSTTANGGNLYSIEQATPGYQKSDSNVQALRIKWKEDGYQIVSATSRQYINDANFSDFGTLAGSDPFNGQTAYENYNIKETSYTEELRVESTDEKSPLAWNAGFFFGSRSNETLGSNTFQNYLGAFNGVAAFPNNAQQESYALFGQSTYTFWDKLDVTAGLRLELADNSRQSSLSDSSGLFPNIPYSSGTKNTAAASPVAAIQYRWTPDQMTYFRFSRGFQPGDISSVSHDLTEADDQYAAQISTNYELGHKSTFFDNKLVVNPVLYYSHYDNYQQYVNLGGPVIPEYAVFNANSAHAMGAELQLSAEPVPGLTLASNLGIQQAKYDDFSMNGNSYDGLNIPNIPSFSAKNSVTYRYSIDKENTLMAMFEANVTGQYYYDAGNTGAQEPFTVCNAKIGYEWTHAAVYLFGTNLFQANYLPSAINNGIFAGTPGDPQTFGVEVHLTY